MFFLAATWALTFDCLVLHYLDTPVENWQKTTNNKTFHHITPLKTHCPEVDINDYSIDHCQLNHLIWASKTCGQLAPGQIENEIFVSTF